MKVLLISGEGWPYPTGNGNAVLLHGLLHCFAELGYAPYFAPFRVDAATDQAKRSRRYLEEGGIRLVEFDDALPLPRRKRDKLRQLILPRDEMVLPCSDRAVDAIHRNSGVSRFDAVIGYSWHALALSASVRASTRIASLVDLLPRHIELRKQLLHQLPLWRRAQTLNGLRHLRRLDKLAMAKLREHDLILEHASHHTEELRAMGFPNVLYLPHPMARPDTPMVGPADSRTVLIPGSLKGAASRLGFEFFLESFLPAFRRLRRDEERDVRFRIVGHGTMLPRLAARLREQPEVDLVGFADDIVAEYRNAAMVLVTIPLDQGFRTRIAECFGRGICVVLHGANTAGMPEIVDGENALVATTGDEMAARALRALREPVERARIGTAARETFTRHYAFEAAIAKLRTSLGHQMVGDVVATT